MTPCSASPPTVYEGLEKNRRWVEVLIQCGRLPLGRVNRGGGDHGEGGCPDDRSVTRWAHPVHGFNGEGHGRRALGE